MFLEISQNSQENTCARVSFYAFFTEHLWATASLVNNCAFIRTHHHITSAVFFFFHSFFLLISVSAGVFQPPVFLYSIPIHKRFSKIIIKKAKFTLIQYMIALKRNHCLKATKSNIQSIIFFWKINWKGLLQPASIFYL